MEKIRIALIRGMFLVSAWASFFFGAYNLVPDYLPLSGLSNIAINPILFILYIGAIFLSYCWLETKLINAWKSRWEIGNDINAFFAPGGSTCTHCGGNDNEELFFVNDSPTLHESGDYPQQRICGDCQKTFY